jgi:hypothetical protein
MRVMVIVKASKESEAGKMPSKEMLAAMGNFNEELAKAGILLSCDGLHPSAKGSGCDSRETGAPSPTDRLRKPRN